MANKSIKSTLWKRPALLALALLLILAMLRLGVWQLDRASQKQVILDEQVQRSKLAAVSLSALDQNGDDLRFRRVEKKLSLLIGRSLTAKLAIRYLPHLSPRVSKSF